MAKELQKGSALLTALFIITLIAIITTAMTARLRMDIYRTHLIDNTDRLYLASQGATFWAMGRLNDPKQILTKTAGLGIVLQYPKTLQRSYPSVNISAQLIDLQSCFNLNNLLTDNYQPIFYGLLGELHIGKDSYTRKEIMDAVINWIQPAKSTATHDEWFDRYAKQKPFYFPSHFPMHHLSEFRLVYGVSAKYYQRLSPYITALPETTPININTVSKKILKVLGDGVNEADVARIMNERSQQPYKNINEVMPFLNKYKIKPEVVTLESQYFLLITTTTRSDVTLKYFTILKRIKDKTGLWHTNILSQSINTL